MREIPGDTLARSRAVSAALRQLDLRHRAYALQRPDRIARVRPLPETPAHRRYAHPWPQHKPAQHGRSSLRAKT